MSECASVAFWNTAGMSIGELNVGTYLLNNSRMGATNAGGSVPRAPHSWGIYVGTRLRLVQASVDFRVDDDGGGDGDGGDEGDRDQEGHINQCAYEFQERLTCVDLQVAQRDTHSSDTFFTSLSILQRFE